MKHKATGFKPAHNFEYVAKTTCDLCNGEVGSRDNYRTDEVTVKYREGKTYPECGSGTETEFDICHKCFKDKLVPMLKAAGANPTVTELDY